MTMSENGPYDYVNDAKRNAPKGPDKVAPVLYLLMFVGGLGYFAYHMMGRHKPIRHWGLILGLAILIYVIRRLIRGGLRRL